MTPLLSRTVRKTSTQTSSKLYEFVKKAYLKLPYTISNMDITIVRTLEVSANMQILKKKQNVDEMVAHTCRRRWTEYCCIVFASQNFPLTFSKLRKKHLTIAFLLLPPWQVDRIFKSSSFNVLKASVTSRISDLCLHE